MKLLLFLILLIICWPAALLAVILYPFIWLVLLPFRLVGIVVGGVSSPSPPASSAPSNTLHTTHPNPPDSRLPNLDLPECDRLEVHG
jgi:hypothetical protein